MFNQPLTTRDARHQYLKANRPSTPPALRYKRNRLEQQREREEKEAEKSRKRARHLREQKKAREEQARLEKRRLGLPTAPKRPSQGLIMGFVRKESPSVAALGEPDIEEGFDSIAEVESDEGEPHPGNEEQNATQALDPPVSKHLPAFGPKAFPFIAIANRAHIQGSGCNTLTTSPKTVTWSHTDKPAN